jgi:T5SS/PEP-CTERM-associated repeat protein/autotransporter-associated beta strand protein
VAAKPLKVIPFNKGSQKKRTLMSTGANSLTIFDNLLIFDKPVTSFLFHMKLRFLSRKYLAKRAYCGRSFHPSFHGKRTKLFTLLILVAGAIFHQVNAEEFVLGNDEGSNETENIASGTHEFDKVKVGVSGTGTLNIEQGGAVSSVVGTLGWNAGSSGTVNVHGLWTNEDALYVGRYGIGVLNIEQGGAVSAGELGSFVGYSGTGTLNIAQGGSLSGYVAALGSSAGSNGTATVSGSWNNYTMTIGFEGTGTLNIEQGGSLSTDGYSTLAGAAGSNGTVNVRGFWMSGVELYVGLYGTGTLNIAQEGHLSAQYVDLGYDSDSNGSATVSGIWVNDKTLRVGVYGSGALDIEQGGSVSSETSYLGVEEYSQGTARVKGSWLNDILYVGYSGTGTLEIEQGGVVSNIVGILGENAGSSGTVTVSGSWDNESELCVGYFGTGTLNVAQEGSLSSSDSYLGYFSDSSGSATVSGTWVNDYDLYVGYSGTGALEIGNGGVVSALNVVLGSEEEGSGTLHLSSLGTLVAGEVGKGEGSALLNLDGGTLRATRDNNSYFSTLSSNDITLSGGVTFDTNGYNVGISTALSGAGTLIKTGSGTLTFSGSHAHTGEVSVDGGLLEIDGSLDSVRITVNGGGTVGGGGKVNEVVLNQYGLISPGGSVGTLHTGNQIWHEGSGYLWEIGSFIEPNDWDLLEIDGTLTLNPGTTGISILVSALNFDGASNLPLGFDANNSYRFTIATTTGGIIGFDPNAFVIDTGLFGSEFEDFGKFVVSISLDGKNLELDYIVIPEPGTWSLALGGGLLAFALARRKRDPNEMKAETQV